ncbi:hypothetical protein CBL_11030 [Carabus blaptoides fortunei]
MAVHVKGKTKSEQGIKKDHSISIKILYYLQHPLAYDIQLSSRDAVVIFTRARIMLGNKSVLTRAKVDEYRISQLRFGFGELEGTYSKTPQIVTPEDSTTRSRPLRGSEELETKSLTLHGNFAANCTHERLDL